MKNSLFSLLIVMVFCLVVSTVGQDIGFERDRHSRILDLVKDDVKKNYYDPTFKGIDIEGKYKTAREKVRAATSISQMSSIIAQFILDFDDSHLIFYPPGKANKVAYGFDFYMVGDKCRVKRVDKESDAAKKGLQVGDELYSIDGYEPTRENLWKMRYAYYSIRPRGGISVVAVKPDGKSVQYDINAKITVGKALKDLTGSSGMGFDFNEYIRDSEDAIKRETRQYFYDKLDGVFVWKMPGFSLDPSKIDDIVDRAKHFPAMIVDLRGNGGGRVDMLLKLLGNMFPKDTKVADEKRRKETKESIAKTRGNDLFTGKIVVLVDSESASASEVFARVLQIEKRGTVLGDRSAGAVMESMIFSREIGLDVVATFATSITIADLTMKDGKSLEKMGVTPDEVILPTGRDMFLGRDVVMARAVELLGGKISAEDAGKIFPPENDLHR